MLSLSPFLLFDGNCAEAMTFYHSCLGGELTVTRLGDTPMKQQMPASLHEKVVSAQLKSGMITFTATDWMHATRKPLQGNTVCLYITGESYEELKAVFDHLSADADPALLDELKEMPFGIYGHLADKYGVHWFFRGAKQ